MNTNDCTCDAYGNRCTLHDERNEDIEAILLEEEINND